jgi:hypothetical protein
MVLMHRNRVYAFPTTYILVNRDFPDKNVRLFEFKRGTDVALI